MPEFSESRTTEADLAAFKKSQKELELYNAAYGGKL